MHISIGSDHSGFLLKKTLKNRLKLMGHAVKDCGAFSEEPSDYPDYANAVCNDIIDETSSRGILICSTGIGMSIAANRHKSVRAALCVNETMAIKSRQHNDANVLILGAKLVDEETAVGILQTFLSNDFEGGRHLTRLSKIS